MGVENPRSEKNDKGKHAIETKSEQAKKKKKSDDGWGEEVK